MKGCAQVAPQLIPAGLDVTVPLPVPLLPTVSVSWTSVNVAVTVVAALMGTTQSPVPVQPPPDQPLNIEPVPAAAVSVIIWPRV